MTNLSTPHVVIFYFSGTGNTWWASHEAGRIFSQQGWSATVASIEVVSREEAALLVSECDLLGIGYPVHGSDLPRPMQDFLEGLPDSRDQKKSFTFCTQWLWSGDGAKVAADVLLRKGYSLAGGEHLFMPNNVSVSALPIPYSNDEGVLGRGRMRTHRRLTRFVDRIIKKKPHFRGFNPVSVGLGLIQRIPYQRMAARLTDDIRVDPQLCTDCGLCLELCPVQNLFREEGVIRARGCCINCLRCYSFCPEQAVAYRGRLHNPQRGLPYRGPVADFDPGLLRRDRLTLKSTKGD